MKIIQTLWTGPGLNAGWMDRRYHFFSWALSCLQLRKYYDEVELYTDDLGKRLLIDEFGLPYTKVHLTLNDFPYPRYLWAAPKLLSYGMQDEPFLHVDGDVFLFQPIHKAKLNRDFVYQNEEMESFAGAFYTTVIQEIKTLTGDLQQLPPWLSGAPVDRIRAVNAGVYGGHGISFFKRHSAMAFEFFNRLAPVIGKMGRPEFANHVAEQVLAAQLLEEQNIDHAGLFTCNHYLKADHDNHCSGPVPPDDQNEYSAEPTEFGYLRQNHFGISPHGRKYIHMIGALKGMKISCNLLSKRLLADYPEYHSRILRYFAPEKEIAKVGRFSMREKALTFPKEKIFEKTCGLYRLLTAKPAPLLPGNGDLPDGTELLREAEDAGILDRVADVFCYETERYRFALDCPDDKTIEDIAQRSAGSQDKIYSPSQPDLQLFRIRINPYSKQLNTQYHWLDKAAYDLDEPGPSPTHFILHIDNITRSMIEVDLTPLNIALLSVFSEPRSYGQGWLMLNEQYPVIREEENSDTAYFQCVIYMIAHSLLIVE
ncbi:MAG TPA: DUF6734 family protein [Puia sp.]|nr:DUF6734 family protein [Puia sp.]